jgi:hypothetical protein
MSLTQLDVFRSSIEEETLAEQGFLVPELSSERNPCKRKGSGLKYVWQGQHGSKYSALGIL